MIFGIKHYLENHPVCHDVVGRSFQPRAPGTLDTISAAEAELGFVLPNALRDIYLEVANGGFGPGYGVMGVRGGFTDDQDHTVEDAYRIYSETDPEDPTWAWPQGWLPMCHWGCAVYSAVDCLSASNPVYFADIGVKEPGEAMTTILHKHKESFGQWLDDWMDGKDLWGEVRG